MTFLEIIKDSTTDLPIEYSGSFRELITEKIDSFGKLIDDSDDLSADINGTPFNEEVFKKRNKILRNGIIQTIDIYYSGDPSKAYQCLSKALNDSRITGYLDKRLELKPHTDLFRIRQCNQNYALTKTELFHIPFELRNRVNSQRYSIPGLPSLYLSNSIYVAWEELKRPPVSDIHASRIVNNQTLRLLDLTTDIFVRNEHLTDNTSYGWQLLYKVMVWPLMAACSVKVQYGGDPFKPEYIMPQLLLQWVNKSRVFGIKYSSTHIDLRKKNHEGLFYNVVIPVRTFDLEKGQCPELLKTFGSTQVIPLQLRQIISNSDRLAHQASIHRDVNVDIQSLELIQGYNAPYSSTAFGTLEHSLKGIAVEQF